MKPILENLTTVSPSYAHFLVKKAVKSSTKQEVSIWINHYRYPQEPYNETKILDGADSNTTGGFSSAEEFKISQEWYSVLSRFDSNVFRNGLSRTNVQELRDLNLNQILTKLERLGSH